MVEFATGWRRCVPEAPLIISVAIAFHHVLMMLLAVAIALFALLLAGCTSTSSSILSIYLLSLSYQHGRIVNDTSRSNPNLPYLLRATAGNTTLEVRNGYFMLCVSSDPRQGIWECDSNTATLARSFASQDPLNLIQYSDKFMSQVVFCGLIIAAIILAMVAILSFSSFPGWHTSTSDTGSEHEVKPFPSRTVMTVIRAALSLAVLLSFVSILWQHVATAAVATSIGTTLDGVVVSHIGSAIMILGWLGVAVMTVPLLGIIILQSSIGLLDRLVEDDDDDDNEEEEE